jgi:hypothetical protein
MQYALMHTFNMTLSNYHVIKRMEVEEQTSYMLNPSIHVSGVQ